MRASKSSLKLLVVVVALAGLWLGAPHIGKRFSSDTPSADKSGHAAAQIAQVDQHLKHAAMNPASLPAGTVWTLRDGKTEHTYAIALDELYLPGASDSQRIHRIPAQSDLPSLLSAARSLSSQSGIQPQLVLYPLSGPHDDSSRRIVTMKIHIQTDDLAAVQAAAASLGLSAWSTPSFAPGHAIAQISSSDPSEPLRIAALLSKLPHVSSAAPLLAHQLAKRTLSTPTDTLFSQQWHLKNTGQLSGTPGMDINVTPIWPTFDGAGVTIGIVDDGLQITHPDLITNVSASDNYDWNGDGVTQDSDPSPDVAEDFHGTACAGLAAARDNGFGVVGAAPRATLYGLRLIALPSTDLDQGEAMAWKNDIINIKSNSWGPSDGYPYILGDAGDLWLSAVTTGTTSGRGGLGTIYVFAAGNGKSYGDQGSKDAYASNINVIAVSALTNTGTSTTYSEGGAHIVVSAPGGDLSPGPRIVTTDLAGNNGYNTSSATSELSDKDYTKNFNGTSAATPIVSGVVALMLEANPLLGWRDVKEILLRSSTQIHPADTDWVSRDGGQPSLPLIKHHTYYGGGLINAQAATDLASTWTNLGTETVVTLASNEIKPIPDAGAGILKIPFVIDSSSYVRVEHVEVTVNIVHPYRGDLEIKLTSPSGVVSTLATSTLQDFGSDYVNWTFSSVRHWGESSTGTWTLSVQDKISNITGYVTSATLKVHGVAALPPAITLQPTGSVVTQGSDVSLTTAVTGSALSYQWSKDGKNVAGAKGPTLRYQSILLAQAGTYICTITNPAGSVTTDPVKVVVYNDQPQTLAANTGSTFNTPLLAAGPMDSYVWSFNGSPIDPLNTHYTGATGAALSVRNITSADNGTYTVLATFNSAPLTTGAITFAVRVPPVVSAPGSVGARLGNVVTIPVTTDNSIHTYAYTGLPKGLTYNRLTGAIIGRAALTGTFPLVLTVTDAFGFVSPPVNITLVVDPVPAGFVGVFNGAVDRDATLNQNLGGTITFTTTATGLLTGKLTLGATSYSFSGGLDGATGDPASVTITIPRKGLSSLTLHLDLPLDDTPVTGTVNTVGVTAWRKAAATPTYAGNYTFALETPAGAGWPAGYSTGTLVVSTAGAVTWTLQPADGTAAIKGTTTLSPDGTLPLFAPVKTPVGSFLGFFSLPVNSSPASSIGGSVTWLRAATTSTTLANSAGFGPLAMTLHGGLYTAPASGSPVLGIPVAADNLNLVFGGTDVDLGAQAAGLAPFTVTINGQNKVITPPVNPTALKLTVNASTGTFSGTFVLTDPSLVKLGSFVKRNEKFTGVLLLQDSLGAGSFVLPPIQGTGNGTRSGSVIFIQAH